MTKKKCIKLIMGTLGLPKPRAAEKIFSSTREWMHGEAGTWPSNQEVLMAVLTAMVKTLDIGFPPAMCALAEIRLLVIKASAKREHDRLMGGPAKEPQV